MASTDNQLSSNGLLMRAVKINLLWLFFFFLGVGGGGSCVHFLHAINALASRRCSWQTAEHGGTRAKQSDIENILLALWMGLNPRKRKRKSLILLFLFISVNMGQWKWVNMRKKKNCNNHNTGKEWDNFFIIINLVLHMTHTCYFLGFFFFFCKIYCWKYNHAFIWDLETDYFNYRGASLSRIISQPCSISSCSTLCLYQSAGVQNKDLSVQTAITLSSPETSVQA